MEELRENRDVPSQRIVDMAVDLAEDGAPDAVVERAMAEFGHVDVLICNHARSGGDGALGDLTAEMLWMRTGLSTRGPRSCWCRPSLPSTTAGPEAASC